MMRIAGQPWSQQGSYEWGFCRFRTEFCAVPFAFFWYHPTRAAIPPGYDRPNVWTIGFQVLGWGFSYGNVWHGYPTKESFG